MEQQGSVDELSKQWAALEPAELIRAVFHRFGEQAAISTSFQKSGMVILEMASRLGIPHRVYFVDTLLNHPETYDYLATVRARYGDRIEVVAPDPAELDRLLRDHGQHCHLFSVPERELCCRIRKVNPARRFEAGLAAVISGLRSDQSEFRASHFARVMREERDGLPPLWRVHPLFDWREEQVDAYLAEHQVPLHPLYGYVSPCGERYRVIGCRCCHFPVQDWRPRRAGKFPWETGGKECGLHLKDGAGI